MRDVNKLDSLVSFVVCDFDLAESSITVMYKLCIYKKKNLLLLFDLFYLLIFSFNLV